MRIAHLSAEVTPFAKSGGLGDVVGALPKAQQGLGHDVQVWMPLYREVWQAVARLQLKIEPACDPFFVPAAAGPTQVGILRTTLPDSQVNLFLVGSDPHFDRPNLYSPDYFGQDDGIVRYSIFVRAALQAMERLWLTPDVLHTHDWHAALAPLILATTDSWVFNQTTTMLTIHNLAYQGAYAAGTFATLGLPAHAYQLLEWHGAVNLLKGGIATADTITAVSPTFAHEITTPAGGFGLDPMLRARRADLFGIVNGIDSQVWNPGTDRLIAANYSAETLERKRENRLALLTMTGMDPANNGMVVGCIGRLTSQKGYDLLFPVLDDLLRAGIRFIFLGSGEDHLERTIQAWSARRPGRFWGYVGFKEDLAHLIEAGSDAFLMPSRFEPCGLNQLYSLAYGTPPIVRRTGGLADTVIPYSGWNGEWATGFDFEAETASALRDTVLWAAHCFRDPHLWTRIVRNGMRHDFSWSHSAIQYLDLYQRGLDRRRG
jgi:starch synthase